MESNFKIKVPGTNFYLESNQTYRIEPRIDSSAPYATTKDGKRTQLPITIPNGMSSVAAYVPYDSIRKVWNTGLYKTSPCYSKLSKEEVDETIELIEKYLLPELELSFPKDALVPPGSNEVFDDYRFKVFPKRTYSTNTAIEFFHLWIAFLSDVIIDSKQSEDKSTEIRSKRIPFAIFSKGEKVKGEASIEFEKSKATSKFITLLESEKDHEKELLIDVLNYIGLSANSKTDSKLINSVFTNWINNKDNSSKNVTVFNDMIKYFSTEEGEEEMAIYKGLLEGKKQNTISRSRGDYFIGSENIGSRLKEAAKKINKDNNLKELFQELA